MTLCNRRALGPIFLLLVAVAPGMPAAAPRQASNAAEPASSAAVSGQLASRVPREQFAELRVGNRPIITFRAMIVPRSPSERAEGAERILSQLADAGVTGPVASRPLLDASVVTVAGRDVFAIVADDVDATTGEDLVKLTSATIERLHLALGEAAETRTPQRVVWAAALSLLATSLVAGALLLLVRVHRSVAHQFVSRAETRLAQSRVGSDPGLLRASRLLDVARGLAGLGAAALALIAVYAWATFVLQQFPVTRPWGEALGGFLLATGTSLAWNGLSALPGLFTAVVIFAVTRFATRILALFFDAVEQGRIEFTALTSAKIAPTRRILTTLVWMSAIILAYPYLPGSHTEAFKGASIFLGLVVSLGSSGVVNQVMSGFMLTYADALSPGDYVRIGDVEGTVTSLGILSTKVKTRQREEVTIPNAVVIGGTTINYTRYSAEGVYARTSVTIGYDTPWRQVESLLLTAAARAAGIRRDPPPYVQQTDLSDFYVEYTLFVCPDEAELRKATLATLRAHIQDAFNEFGVQIMSPHYEADPGAAKVVAPDRWFEAPAQARPEDTALLGS
jgi:small-conductance mechanosensitive channel